MAVALQLHELWKPTDLENIDEPSLSYMDDESLIAYEDRVTELPHCETQSMRDDASIVLCI